MVKKFIIAIESPIPIFGTHTFIQTNEVKFFMFRILKKDTNSPYTSSENDANNPLLKTYNSMEEAESVIDNYLKDKPDDYQHSFSIIPIYTKN